MNELEIVARTASGESISDIRLDKAINDVITAAGFQWLSDLLKNLLESNANYKNQLDSLLDPNTGQIALLTQQIDASNLEIDNLRNRIESLEAAR